MRAAGLHSQTGYGKRRFKRSGPASVVAQNHLQRQFDVTEPNKGWVTDIAYIRTHEGCLYLAAVIDLLSRQVIGWSMGSRMDRELALSALLMTVWRRKPQRTVMVHFDQGSQFSSYDWRDFLKAHNLEQSMSRRGNCHDNAVAKSFFSDSSGSAFAAESTLAATRPGTTSSTISRCSTIQSADTASAITCRRLSMKSSISSGSEVSRKAVAIQNLIHFQPGIRIPLSA
jgi:transposase InsO family protein